MRQQQSENERLRDYCIVDDILKGERNAFAVAPTMWLAKPISRPREWIDRESVLPDRANVHLGPIVASVTRLGARRELRDADEIATEQAIEESRSLLELEPDWDGEDALPIADETWKRAMDFIRSTNDEMRLRLGKGLPAPTIGACADGSIDFYWDMPKFRLLVNIQPLGRKASDYYAKRSDGLEVKGTLGSATNLSMLGYWLETS